MDEEAVEVSFYCAFRNVENIGNFRVLAPLEQQIHDLLLAAPESAELVIHALPHTKHRNRGLRKVASPVPMIF
jgi:hypothetical protein